MSNSRGSPQQLAAASGEDGPSLFVVVPAYNEERQLGPTVRSLVELGYKVVVVDDGSRDGTWSALGQLPVYALRHPINLGQGAALQTGMTYALRQGADVVIHFDGDGQHQVDDIPALVEPILRDEADVVLGSRFLRSSDAAAVPPLKRALLQAGVLVNRALTGVTLTDAHNGFRALNRKALQCIKIRENRYAHATELLAEIHRHGLRYVERPTTISYTAYSLAKGQPLWNALNIVIDVVLRKVFQ
jgi:glycosyltransferase involved in cell wall biosynthesis